MALALVRPDDFADLDDDFDRDDLDDFEEDFDGRLDAGVFVSAALEPRRLRFASDTARRLVGPRTGERARKIHPTPGTCLPPSRRPSWKSQS
ncbi:MAG TPA: hypothetical protein DCS55_12010 [Acidimicrobiaceae bacterium]|nr:hypothetical protein [Acidimicrobiaceae bacterium]